MKTRDKIIEAALKLFNKEGINSITLRDIAQKIEISYGNLAYHFKNKEQIIDEIYTQMDIEMSGVVFPEGDLTLGHYHSLLKKISAFQRHYEFFYIDMLEISRKYPKVIQRYRKTISFRSHDYEQLINFFIRKELVKAQTEQKFYKSLFHSIWVMSTFWLQHKRILGSDHPMIESGNDIKHVWEILLPHLTEKGLKEYKTISRKEENPLDEERPIQKMYLKKIAN